MGIALPGVLVLAAFVLVGTAADQKQQYDADVPKTILELQQFRQSSSVQVVSGSGRQGVATLVNLNPTINTWYVLQVAWKDGAAEPAAHLENPKPQQARLILDEQYPSGIVVQEGSRRHLCERVGTRADPVGGLEQARQRCAWGRVG